MNLTPKQFPIALAALAAATAIVSLGAAAALACWDVGGMTQDAARSHRELVRNLVAVGAGLPCILLFLAVGVWLKNRTFHPPGECSHCGYSLVGLPRGRCPECGAEPGDGASIRPVKARSASNASVG